MPRVYTKRPEHDRFWEKVNKGDGCWVWTAATAQGYGTFRLAAGAMVGAHRWAYEQEYGTIPEGLQVDHKCHNRDDRCPGGVTCLHRLCVRPAHLRTVSPRVNTLAGKTLPANNVRKTRCPQGHPYDTVRRGRECRRCNNRMQRESVDRHRDEVNKNARISHRRRKVAMALTALAEAC
ncbi:hypothetical protein LCGC14_2861550 [marine sediment metagenome]|uniref:HNH nuclease domain-containing protein n=1 Tax=marine sediment metagenome TaxID=412755 RepID=A0A0F8YS81_9ZZZZ